MWMVTVLVFGIFFVGPGPTDVARRIAGKNATPQTVQLDPGAAAPQPADRGAVLGLPQAAGLAPQPRLLVLPPAAGHDRPQAGASRSRSPWRSGRPIIWLVLGVLSGVLSAVRRGSFWDRSATTRGSVLLLDADVRPGPAAAVRVLLPVHHPRACTGSPGQGYTYFTDSPVKWFRGPGLAVVDAGPGLGGRLHPADAGLAAGGAG